MVISDVDPWDSQHRTQKRLGTKRFPVGLPSTHTLVAWKKNMMEVKGTPPSFLCPSYLFLRTKMKRTVTAIND